MFVGASCTAELIQDDPAGLAKASGLPVPIIPLELPSYQKKENWGASETFYQLVRALARPAEDAEPRAEGARPRCNLLGPTALGFRHRDDVREITHLLDMLGVNVNVCAPLNATVDDIARLGEADFNVVMYPEIADVTARWLERNFKQPRTTTVPIGVGATRDFIHEVAEMAGIDPAAALEELECRLPWYSRSIDSNYLTGKRVFIFADATHALAAARIGSEELGYEVVGLGTYSREFARDLRAKAKELGIEALITDDYLEVEQQVQELQPELVLGTQMERHIAKRLGIACAVISAPVHVQDYPARTSPQMGFEGAPVHVQDYPARTSPQMGFEGANVIFDDWVHPLMMGLEEHLLGMFREDFEFNDDAVPSHLAMHGETGPRVQPQPEETEAAEADDKAPIIWEPDAEKELRKIPFFVRGKAKRNAEAFATEKGLSQITVETLYDAKAHFGR